MIPAQKSENSPRSSTYTPEKHVDCACLDKFMPVKLRPCCTE